MTQFAPFTPVDPHEHDTPLPLAEPEGSHFGKAHHILLIFAGVAVLVWLLSGFYKVNPDEVAIVERLGQFVSTTPGAAGKADLYEPGLHYHLPWPIDTAYVISTKKTRNLVVDMFNSTPQAYEEVKQQYILDHPGVQIVQVNALFDPYLITGDKDIVHMQVAVQYTVDDPEAWLMAVSHEELATESQGMREEVFQQVIQHAMVHMVSSLTIDDILFTGRDRLKSLLEEDIADALQLPDPDDPTHTRRIHLGLHVEQVDLVEARPPAYVQPAFDQVTSARSRMVSETTLAQTDANTAITQARSQVPTQIGAAQSYQKQTIESANGEALRFKQVLEQYEKAPDVTRYNVYTDAVRTVAGNANRLMFAQPGQQVTLTINPPQFDAGQLPANP